MSIAAATDEDLARLLRRSWTTAILGALIVDALRYTDIRNACAGINPATLTGGLRELERIGIVEREWFDESPPRVEYTLTQPAGDDWGSGKDLIRGDVDPFVVTLFSPFPQRSLTLRNRIVVSPMCQYSAPEGMPHEWHQVHLGSRAVGGAALVIAEATAVLAEGRITPWDTGIWNDAQAEAWSRIAAVIEGNGAVAGMQLAHAGRKAGTDVPWRGGSRLEPADGGWIPVAPSAISHDPTGPSPTVLDAAGIAAIVEGFRDGAARAAGAGFRLLEVHAAHGYLLHEFLSPLANERHDDYGGSFDNRARLLLEVIGAVRTVWPEELPLWVRISATDWADGGWDIDQSVELAGRLRAVGVDLVDVSSGGLVRHQQVEPHPGYQVPFAERIRRETGIATGAVGLITEPEQAASIIASDQADVVLLAREMLRDPYFARRAAEQLGGELIPPSQYLRAW